MDYQAIVRRWLAGDGVRSVARGTGLDRKTVRRILRAAERLGLKPGSPVPDDKAVAELIGEVRGVQPTAAPGETEMILLPHQNRIRRWLEADKLLLTRVHDLLTRDGILVPYISLYRFARKWCEFGRSTSVTVRRCEGQPAEYAEVDFGRLGYLQELGNSKPRVVHGFIMVLGYSRLSCVVPVFRQDLESVIRCFEEAFCFFGGCPKRIVLDNLKSCVELADTITRSGYLNYQANAALVRSDLWPALFGDDREVAGDVAINALTIPLALDVGFLSSGFDAGGIDPYFTLFAGIGNSAKFLRSNY